MHIQNAIFEPSLQFLGATQTVTGSRYLVRAGDLQILVDCGLFQGYKVLRERNWSPFPVDPDSIDAVLLTHAHLDHTGYLPALVRDGFSGPIYATAGTTELCQLLLPDSAHLLEEEARYARDHRFSRHEKPRPLYTSQDATKALNALRVVAFNEPLTLGAGVQATFLHAGHILGAAQIRLDVGGKTVHFTGDLGRADDPLMKPPQPFDGADVLVTESTYGNRLHPQVDPTEQLAPFITRVVRRSGVVLIPAFAVGRPESILLHLSRMRERGSIPKVPIFLNSPMAVNAAQMYQRHPEEQRVGTAEYAGLYDAATLVHSVDESKLLNLRGGPMIIISASGMLTGGRILHHLQAYGSDRRNAIILTGYQAGGTRGAALERGERTLRIFGRDVPIRAEVLQLESLSAHADADALIAWMRTAPHAPAMTYVTHGEPDSAEALRIRIKHELKWDARVPEQLDLVDLANPR
jgi:metallo-beta-lactamase family protein